MNPEDLISTEAFAKLTGMTVDQVRYQARAGNISCAHKVGGRWKFEYRNGHNRPMQIFPDHTQFEPEKSVQWFDDRWYKVPTEEGGVTFYQSVTTTLGIMHNHWLSRWRGDVGNREADRRMMEAADAGSRIHHACYIYANEGIVLLDNKVHSRYSRAELQDYQDRYDGKVMILYDQAEHLQVLRFAQWLSVVQPKILGAEMTVFSHKYKIAGTLDYLMEIRGGIYPVNNGKDILIPGGIYVLDLKSGRVVDQDRHPMQVAAYAACAEEPSIHNPIRDIRIQGGIILYTQYSSRRYNGGDDFGGVKTDLQNRQKLDDDFADYMAAHRLWLRNNAHSKPKIFDMPYQITMKPITEENSSGNDA